MDTHVYFSCRSKRLWSGSTVHFIVIAIAIISCSKNKTAEERREQLSRAQAHAKSPAANVTYELEFFHSELVTARCEVVGRENSIHHISYSPSPQWKSGTARSWGCSRSGAVMSELAPTIPEMLESSQLDVRCQFSVFQSTVHWIVRSEQLRSHWSLYYHDNGFFWCLGSLQSEVGFEQKTGKWLWTLHSIGSRYARLRLSANVDNLRVRRLLLHEGYHFVDTQADLDAGVGSWVRDAPELAVAAPWLARCCMTGQSISGSIIPHAISSTSSR